MILLLISFSLSIFNIFLSKYLFTIDRCVINRGIAFGISIEYIFIISILFLIILIVLGYINKGIVRYILFSIFLFGLSNLITRLLLGGICDYLAMSFLTINIADLGVVVLSILAVIKIIVLDTHKS